MPEAGVIQRWPRILFLDGTVATLFRQEAPCDGKVKLHLILDDWAKRYLGLSNEKDIDFKEPHMTTTGRGIWHQSYKEDDLIYLSKNPEFPWILALCTARAEKKVTGTKLDVILKHQEKIQTLKNQNTELTKEVERLREKVNTLMDFREATSSEKIYTARPRIYPVTEGEKK